MSLEVSDLRIDIGGRPVVDGISFDVPDGARVGLIGESGSGKSMTALSITPASASISLSISFG